MLTRDQHHDARTEGRVVSYREFVDFYAGKDWDRVARVHGVYNEFRRNLEAGDMVQSEAAYHAFINDASKELGT